MSKEAMKLGREALETERENYQDWDKQDGAPEYIYEAITALREALAEQPAQQQNGPINEGWQITVAHGHSGYGVYAHMEGYPEEGAVLVQAIEQPAQQEPVLQDIEQYRLQMAGISTAAIGYWKESDGILPDYDTIALRDVAKLYAKYDELYRAQRKPLTDEELRKLADKHLFYQPEGYEVSGMFAFARAIEAAHGIKENT